MSGSGNNGVTWISVSHSQIPSGENAILTTTAKKHYSE